jgi:hypothetical protein
MPTATSLVETFSTQVSDTVEKAQTEALKAVRSWTGTIEGTLPESITSLELLDSLPKPDAIVEMAFDLTRKVLDYQADVALSLAGMVDPVLVRLGVENGAAAKPASTTGTTSKSTSAKATPKRTTSATK